MQLFSMAEHIVERLLGADASALPIIYMLWTLGACTRLSAACAAPNLLSRLLGPCVLCTSALALLQLLSLLVFVLHLLADLQQDGPHDHEVGNRLQCKESRQAGLAACKSVLA